MAPLPPAGALTRDEIHDHFRRTLAGSAREVLLGLHCLRHSFISACASKGVADYSLKVLEATRHNANAAFDFASQLVSVKSLSDMVELSTTNARKQFESVEVAATLDNPYALWYENQPVLLCRGLKWNLETDWARVKSWR